MRAHEGGDFHAIRSEERVDDSDAATRLIGATNSLFLHIDQSLAPGLKGFDLFWRHQVNVMPRRPVVV